MAISYSTMRAARLSSKVVVAKSINEAQQIGVKTAFLCHSHVDKELVEGFVAFVGTKGWKVYIDWMDTSLPPIPDKKTAQAIKDKITTTNFFIVLATQNAMASRWCPWEIGFADGVKTREKIFVVPTQDDSGNYHGNEYLQLYKKLDLAKDDRFAVWEPGNTSGQYASTL